MDTLTLPARDTIRVTRTGTPNAGIKESGNLVTQEQQSIDKEKTTVIGQETLPAGEVTQACNNAGDTKSERKHTTRDHSSDSEVVRIVPQLSLTKQVRAGGNNNLFGTQEEDMSSGMWFKDAGPDTRNDDLRQPPRHTAVQKQEECEITPDNSVCTACGPKLQGREQESPLQKISL